VFSSRPDTVSVRWVELSSLFFKCYLQLHLIHFLNSCYLYNKIPSRWLLLCSIQGQLHLLIQLVHNTCTRTKHCTSKQNWRGPCQAHPVGDMDVSLCAQPIGTGSGLIIISLWRQPFQETQLRTCLLGRSSGECRRQCKKLCSPQHLLVELRLQMGKQCLFVTGFWFSAVADIITGHDRFLWK
jgi:hypothetical protein